MTDEELAAAVQPHVDAWKEKEVSFTWRKLLGDDVWQALEPDAGRRANLGGRLGQLVGNKSIKGIDADGIETVSRHNAFKKI